MPDREKVIRGLKQCTSFGEIGLTEDECNDCPYYGESYKTGLCWVEMNRDALALLKEHQEQIETLKQTAQSMMEGIVVSQPQIVRCKDCKHGIGDENAFVCGLKQLTAGMDWFCADGERKE